MLTATEILAKHVAQKSDINEHLQFIHDLVVEMNAQVVVELGVWTGQSTVAILCALAQTGGFLASCDIKDFPNTRKMIADYGLGAHQSESSGGKRRWQFYIGDDLAWGRTLNDPERITPPIDALLIDSSHGREHTEKELRLFAPHVRQGGAILLHDTTAPEWGENIMGAIDAFRADNPGWTFENRENCNGLGILRNGTAATEGTDNTENEERIDMATEKNSAPASESSVISVAKSVICRFPFTPAAGLDSTSGPTVLVAALTDALRADPRFEDINAGPLRADDVPWFPVHSAQLVKCMREGRRVAIGPNVLFGSSQAPGACAGEKELMAYENYAAIFTLSRWYSELTRRHFTQKTNHFILDYILPAAWLRQPSCALIARDAMIYLKGGKEETRIADALRAAFPSHVLIRYGAFTRAQLFEAARTSRACFYISREDHYPLAAVEIGLMGCPIISDERACPVVAHRLTGLVCPVRERAEDAPFTWAADSANRLAAEWPGAVVMDRAAIRGRTIARHSAPAAVERIASALKLERITAATESTEDSEDGNGKTLEPLNPER